MSKPTRPSFATSTVAAITGAASPPIDPDAALWPNAGTIRSVTAPDTDNKDEKDYKDEKGIKDEKDNKDRKEVKPEKVVFSNKLAASTYLKLQQLATYGGENIQEILEAALEAYFVGKEEASRPLPPKVLAALRRRYPFL